MSTTNNNILKKNMIAALEKSLGIVTTACRNVQIDRSTHYRWLKEDEDYKKECDSISDIALDFAESQLHQQIKDKIPSSTIFYLKTKGKRRGYVERTEITGADGGELKIQSIFSIDILNVPTNDSTKEDTDTKEKG